MSTENTDGQDGQDKVKDGQLLPKEGHVREPSAEPSEKQLEVLQYIISHVERWGFQPSQAEIANHFGVTKNAILGRLHELEKRGVVQLNKGQERAVGLKFVRFTAVVTEEE